jgi:hypothetical protein
MSWNWIWCTNAALLSRLLLLWQPPHQRQSRRQWPTQQPSSPRQLPHQFKCRRQRHQFQLRKVQPKGPQQWQMDRLQCHLRPQRRLKWQPVRFDTCKYLNQHAIILTSPRINYGHHYVIAGPSECEDRLAGCDVWFDDGFCENSTDLMSVFCRKTCGFCSTRPEGNCGLIEIYSLTKRKLIYMFVFEPYTI